MDDVVVIPAGSSVSGTVYKAKKSSWWGTKGKLGVRLNRISLANGGVIPINGNIYVTGKNRTPIAVALFLFGSWPLAFIPGTRAEMPIGFEAMATIASFVEFDRHGHVLAQVNNQTGVGNYKPTVNISGHNFNSGGDNGVKNSSNKISGISKDTILVTKRSETIIKNLSVENSQIRYQQKDSNKSHIMDKDKVISLLLPFVDDKDVLNFPCEGLLNLKGYNPFEANKSIPVTIMSIDDEIISYRQSKDSGNSRIVNISKVRRVMLERPNSEEEFGIKTYWYKQY
ncbi:MAG: hypothetical protein IJ209_03410 [Bacteroidaceae bacterium]|nr:hypothetical protein [Bacteroidaceae bacterium]